MLAALSVSAAAAPNLVPRPAAPNSGPALLVFAAASLSEALEEVDRAFTQRTTIPVRASYAASSALARQIEAGAPADLFLCADAPWVDYLDARGFLKRGTRHDLLGNELVLIAPAERAPALRIGPGFELASALGDGRLALADPDVVPAGKYAQAALVKLGVWEQVRTRLARAENTRAALAYVARGAAPLGIVYRTDAQVEKRVRVVDMFAPDSHPPIVYPVALTVSARPQAAQLLEFVMSDGARQIFARYGFSSPPAAPRAPQ